MIQDGFVIFNNQKTFGWIYSDKVYEFYNEHYLNYKSWNDLK